MKKNLMTTHTLLKSTLLGLFASTLTLSSFAAEQGEQPVPVEVSTVSEGITTFTQDLPGRVNAIRTAEVRARVDGILEKRVFTEGDMVKQGDVLFQIDKRQLQADVQAERANLNDAIAQQKLNQQTLERYTTLLELGAVSQQEFDTFAAQNEQAKARVELAKSNLRNAQIQLEYATVTAPISGRIGRAMVTEGALVRAAESTHLATIEQLDKVYVDFTRSSSEMMQLRKLFESGQSSNASSSTVQIFYNDGTQYPGSGNLEFSSWSVEPDTGSVQLRAIVDNPDHLLLPGMFVRVKLPVGESDSLLQVPQKAVTMSANGATVKLIKDGKLAVQPVELGPMVGPNWVVKSGLQRGDQVIVSNTQFLQPGTPVTAMNQPSGNAQNQTQE
ncbi:efflux RND transporter periplasmic adaptor subunit [Kangiella aquimarina]|uniref:Efflux RND transporter periplasmic adaptor subunit n=1 Tax=Kangiella aquimarina TaxID=261965 RepID=A0ABZ0X6J0_9GAMM|nr:efflux RND transporter periplasmic adaptor subunit [Kangiella aquimarina]WQG85979.1 efflux RND transporter periplasmic adaptor subunit [Kangiella aquimarina]